MDPQGGRAPKGWLGKLQNEREALDRGGRTYLASALIHGGYRRDGIEVLRDIPVAPGYAYAAQTSGLLRSMGRDDAVLLLAWLEVDPRHERVAALVSRISAQANDRSRFSTHLNAMVVLAMGRYASLVSGIERSPIKAELILDSDSETFSDQQKDLQLSTERATAGGMLANRGEQRLYYFVKRDGVPKRAQFVTRDEGLRIRRRLATRDGKDVDPMALKQGEVYLVNVMVDPGGDRIENLAIEDLLPAGLEIENPKAGGLHAERSSIPVHQRMILFHQEIRDDRMVVFPGAVHGIRRYQYLVRAVSVGEFVYPAISVECMYDSAVRSISGAQRVGVIR